MHKQTPPLLGNGDQLRLSAQILRALAHPLRLKIIQVIHEKNGDANVGEIYGTLAIEQSVASQHLRVLRQAALVRTRRDRKFIYYSLDYERMSRTVQAVALLRDKSA